MVDWRRVASPLDGESDAHGLARGEFVEVASEFEQARMQVLALAGVDECINVQSHRLITLFAVVVIGGVVEMP